jgi:hypothetical protein
MGFLRRTFVVQKIETSLNFIDCTQKQNVPIFSPSMTQQPLVGQGVLIIETSRSYSDTPHSVGLLWTSDQRDAETST